MRDPRSCSRRIPTGHPARSRRSFTPMVMTSTDFSRRGSSPSVTSRRRTATSSPSRPATSAWFSDARSTPPNIAYLGVVDDDEAARRDQWVEVGFPAPQRRGPGDVLADGGAVRAKVIRFPVLVGGIGESFEAVEEDRPAAGKGFGHRRARRGTAGKGGSRPGASGAGRADRAV